MLTGDEASRRRAGVVAGVAFVVVFALLGATALILKAFSDAPAEAPTTQRAYSCAQLVAAAGELDDDYCRRLVDDLARRPELTGPQRAALSGDLTAVQRAVRQLSSCHGPMVAPPYRSRCAGVPPGGPATEAHAEAVHRVLVEAGYPLAVARLARPDDPAPRSSVLYAVPLNEACIVGHIQAAGGDSARPLAPLPDGRCLKA